MASTLRIAQLLPALRAIGVADPTRTDTDHLQRVEAQLRTGAIIALKRYLGYLYYGPDDPGYRPYFELAGQYDVPFIFHTGDNFSNRGDCGLRRIVGIDRRQKHADEKLR